MAFNIKGELKKWFAGSEKVVLAGIGNPIRSDDYVGLKIVENLRSKIPSNICLLECETVPESFLLEIEEFHPTHVLLVDAALLGLSPGQAKLVELGQVAEFSAVTTHVLPLNIFCEYIKRTTGAKIALLLIEPQNMAFGEGLTKKLQESSETLTEILVEILNH